jgi:ribonuclease HII
MPRSKQEPLTPFYNDGQYTYEIGVDEAGRGPLFGRVYTAAVILPKDDTFKYHDLKDSKKFTSEKKINEVAQYIKDNALAWTVTYNDEKQIDNINIRQAVLNSMHQSIKNTISTCDAKLEDECKGTVICSDKSKYFLLVDGNDFKPYMTFKNDEYLQVPYTCIKGGDNKYCSIAAASILAKTERDKYILELCEEHPELKELYHLDKNKGYGTALHMEGIKNNGISQWHRKSYGPCKGYS